MQAVVFTWSHVEFTAPNRPDGYEVTFSQYGVTTIAGNTRGGKKRAEGVWYPIYRPFAFVTGIYDHYPVVKTR